MKYKCLVLDHDDTVVNSTATVNFKVFHATLKQLRPNMELSLQEFFTYSYEPGFTALCREIIGFNDVEMELQVNNWLAYVREHAPEPFSGIKELLWRFHDEGGQICVVSHSMKENILRDYKVHGLPTPVLVYGWELPEDKRKPSVWPIEQIVEKLGLSLEELVMVDDLKPGRIMAENAGIDFIAAGWAHAVPQIVEDMKRECNYYCSTVEEFAQILFPSGNKE